MFKHREYHRRTPNPIFILFRLMLSLSMFMVLLAGGYSAYKHFSGVDPLKMDPQALVVGLIQSKSPKQALDILKSIQLSQGLPKPISEKILGEKASEPAKPQGQSLFSFALVADSHNDNSYLAKSLEQSKQRLGDKLKFVIGLGDYTQVGTTEELKNAKAEFDKAGIRYFLLVGDHDLWDSRDKNSQATSNFREVFGLTYQSFVYENFRFILLNNADNYSGVDEEQLKWLNSELGKAKQDQNKSIYVFLHEPIYHPSSEHTMGWVTDTLKAQAKSLIHTLKDGGVKHIFFGDIHYFTDYVEPETGLKMTTIGALTTEKNPQAPRYAEVSVYDNGELDIKDVEVR